MPAPYVRFAVPYLARSVFDELRAVPGVRVRRGAVEAPPDAARIAARIAGVPEPNVPTVRKALAVAPGSLPGWERLRSWQKEASVALAEGRKNIVLHPCGSGGKAATLITAAALSGARRTLLVTRAMGIGVYARDAKWATGQHIVEVTGRGPDFKIEAAARVADVVVVNYEVLDARVRALCSMKWDALAFDESHYLRSHKHKGYARWAAAGETIADLCHLSGRDIWLATATFIRDRRRDLWRQLRICHPDGRWGTGWQFGTRYCAGFRDARGGFDNTGASHTDELEARLDFYRDKREKQDTARELPPLTRQVLRVDGAPTGREPRGLEAAIARAADCKLDDAVELAGDVLLGPGKVVLVTNRHAVVPRILAALAAAAKKAVGLRNLQVFCTSNGSFDAAIDTVRRRALCDEYLGAADPAILVATMDAISESIDLQRTDALIFMALPYTPGQVEQVEGRVSRLGGDRPCTVYYLVATGTIDEWIEEVLLSKLQDTEDLDTTTTGTGIVSAFSGGMTDDECRREIEKYLQSIRVVPVEADREDEAA